LELVKESIERMEQSMGGRLRMDDIAAAAHYSYSAYGQVSPKNLEKQRDKIMGEAWTGLILWQVALHHISGDVPVRNVYLPSA
jgi:hypothetical protein